MSLSTPRKPSSCPASFSIGTQLVSSTTSCPSLWRLRFLSSEQPSRSRIMRSNTGPSAAASSSTIRSKGVRPIDLVRGVAEHVRHPVGAGGVPAARVDLPEPVGRGEREVLEARLALAQRELDEPALLYLAGEPRVGLLELAHALGERGGGVLERRGLSGGRRGVRLWGDRSWAPVWAFPLRYRRQPFPPEGQRSATPEFRDLHAGQCGRSRDKMRLRSGSWSGDCRGLQNRLRGDDLVLGGFDSHVAPPSSSLCARRRRVPSDRMHRGLESKVTTSRGARGIGSSASAPPASTVRPRAGSYKFPSSHAGISGHDSPLD